jgi:hypothetical protein
LAADMDVYVAHDVAKNDVADEVAAAWQTRWQPRGDEVAVTCS